MLPVHHALSLSRIPMSVAVLWLYQPSVPARFWWFLVVLALAAFTDFVDGKVARARGQASEFGYVLDGLCDRAFHIALVLAFFLNGYIGSGIAWLLVFRDVAIYAFRLASPDWFKRGGFLRPVSVVHGYGLRLWAAAYVFVDVLFATGLASRPPAFLLGQRVFILAILMVSYYGLWRMLDLAFSADAKDPRDP